ncbi:helix-turn-helix domain-containing protein [Pseudarthrobacter sp. H2]|uniref:helix-turn-helix domain-containing protein n=1 Tax=Pseudarthrobacter sp. H2 TaxID=3418415 RepID=UPI003CF4890E
MINLDDWAEIRHLFSTGKHSKRKIGRIVGVSRGTVDRALESDRAPKCQWPIVCAHGRPAKMPAGGHENCPVMATGSAHQMFGGVGHVRDLFSSLA